MDSRSIDVQELLRELKDLIQRVESAFPKDEYGEPDYSTHRMFHKKQQANELEFAASKTKLIRDVVSWATIGILTIIGSGLVHYIMTGSILPAK